MRRRIGFAVAAAWAVTAVLHSAETPTNPYEPIVARNPFGIKEPPPKPPDVPPVPQVPLPKVILTGIHSMFGPTPSVLLEITETEPGKAANVKRPILRQGDKEGSVEIVSIDVTNNSVRIRNGGIETNLVFEVAKAGPTPGPAMAMAPGMLPGLTPPPTHPGLPTPPPAPTYPGMLTPNPGSAPGANAPGRAGSSVTTYGATSSTDRQLPTRVQPTVTGADLLRESARARGLPVPPLPGAPGR